jgi:hypothetical protein
MEQIGTFFLYLLNDDDDDTDDDDKQRELSADGYPTYDEFDDVVIISSLHDSKRHDGVFVSSSKQSD